MRRSAAVDFTRPMFSFAPSPPRGWIALRAALALALPLIGLTLAGHPQEAFLAGLGVFAVLYGAGAPVRRRLVIIPVAGLGLLASLLLGIATAGHPLLAVLLMSVVAMAATFVTYSLQVGPPAGFFFALDVGIGNLAASHGAPAGTILGVAAVGVCSAIVVGTSDLWFGSHRVEEDVVSTAEALVDKYVHEQNPKAIARSRRTASAALNDAWTAVTDGRSEDLFGGRLQRMHSRYAATVATSVGGPDAEVTAELALYEAASARQVSLGRPRATWSLRQALRWPSEDLLVAARVLVAGAVAGTIALALDNAHAYWAAAFAVLIVHTGGTRRAQLQRSLQRTVGTAAGLLAFGLVLRVDPQHWWLIALVVTLQFVVEVLITRNYTAAVVFLTPLALSISAAVTDMDLRTIVMDRGVDTVIGVGVALSVVLLSGVLGRPELLLRAHARRVVHALDAVLADLAEHRTSTPEGMDAHLHHCRQLYVELLASDQVAARTLADAPDVVAPYREMEHLLAHIGYLVLGATWNPRVRGERERMAEARTLLAEVTDHPVTHQRDAADIAADLRRVQTVLAEA